MRTLFTGTIAALLLGAAVASSQTPPAQPPAGQTPPSTAQPSGQTKPADQTTPASPTAGQKPPMAKGTTYRGFLRGSDTSGWTFSPIADKGASAAPGATATAGPGAAAGATTYSIVAPASAKASLSTMADQCVEIVGTLAPESAASKANRELTVTTIRPAQGCTQ